MIIVLTGYKVTFTHFFSAKLRLAVQTGKKYTILVSLESPVLVSHFNLFKRYVRKVCCYHSCKALR